MARKQLLFIFGQPPFTNHIAVNEAHDFMLLATTFPADINVAFTGEGVWQLKNSSEPTEPSVKNLAAFLQTWELYDIKNIFVDYESMKQRALTANDFAIQTQIIPSSKLQEIIFQHDHVISFGV